MDIVDKTLDRKFADLKKLVSGYGSLIVAYSGGVDSVSYTHLTLPTKA